MLSFEEEMRNYLHQAAVEFDDHRDSPHKLDFRISLGARYYFWLEVKEKRQPTKLSNWPEFGATEENTFILDDLSARKILRQAPYSGVAIRDNVRNKYFFIDVVSLFLMPRIRVNRMLNNTGVLKGKWMINLENALPARTPGGIVGHLLSYGNNLNGVFSCTECYGNFVGEDIPLGGEIRTQAQRAYDYKMTR